MNLENIYIENLKYFLLDKNLKKYKVVYDINFKL